MTRKHKRYHCIRKCNFSTNSCIRGKGWGAIQVNIKVLTSLHLDKTEIIILFATFFFFFFLIGNNFFFLNKKATFNYNTIIRSCMIINKHVLSIIINKQALPIIASIHHQFQNVENICCTQYKIPKQDNNHNSTNTCTNTYINKQMQNI